MSDEVRAAIEEGAQVVAAPAWAAEAVVAAIANRFGIDPASRWWWQGLTGDVQHLPYGEDGLAAVAAAVAGWGVAVLVVIEDEAFPPATYVLDEAGVIAALGNAPFFEYALISPDFCTVVLDTHHNELVVKRVAASG